MPASSTFDGSQRERVSRRELQTYLAMPCRTDPEPEPGQQATGPRTAEGKAKASRNAYKGGHWLMLRELAHMVNAEVKAGRDLVERLRP